MFSGCSGSLWMLAISTKVSVECIHLVVFVLLVCALCLYLLHSYTSTKHAYMYAVFAKINVG